MRWGSILKGISGCSSGDSIGLIVKLSDRRLDTAAAVMWADISDYSGVEGA